VNRSGTLLASQPKLCRVRVLVGDRRWMATDLLTHDAYRAAAESAFAVEQQKWRWHSVNLRSESGSTDGRFGIVGRMATVGGVTGAPSPRDAGFRMPAEWEPHLATWMQFPTGNMTFGPAGSESLRRFQEKWAEVANTVSRYEPVLMVCHPEDLAVARTLLGEGVETLVDPVDDGWARDSGPTFLIDGNGGLGAVHWRFNAWGKGDRHLFENDARIGGVIARASGARVFESSLTNEGGGIHVDGRGTVLVTETVQLDPDRNPGWSRSQVEDELALTLGVSKVIWLRRGLTRDYSDFGTRGHVDILATFTPTGTVLVHDQQDPNHPDHEVSREISAALSVARDASGGPLQIVHLPAPATGFDESGPVDWSYINHYVCNGAVVMCTFDDPHDEQAAALLAEAYPGRDLVAVDAREIFECGGGIHCITQQVPAQR
jgi:agmatine deiminase